MENEETKRHARLIKGYNGRMTEISRDEDKEHLDPLAITESVEVDVELSTGGPSDGFKVYLDKETRKAISACYYLADWGWYKEHWLSDDEIELVVDYFGIC